MREKYESLSLAVLRDLAKARGMKGISTFKKGELVEAMLAEDEKEKNEKQAEEKKAEDKPAAEKEVPKPKGESDTKAEPKEENTKESNQIEEKKSYTFKVTEGNDTRDGSILWVVRIEETLTKDEYIRINKAIKEIGGYYSKFKHGFIFRFEPTEELKKVA